ncbi:Gfo/Idh/MocA family protein [Schlesneria sp. T3-172]|uniref:Gfo/Idh/MocA family protein n=1 Tax=Schlesneria sphaerica TaxID=3373610 RepID=UPI0037C80AC7
MSSDNPQRSAVNRREFLGRSAQRAAGVAVGVVGLTATASAAVASVSAQDRVRVGVIGVRNQGKLLAGELARLQDIEIRSLCDVDESQFAPALHAVVDAGQKAPAIERDFRRLLDDPGIDAVVIATPDHWHARMTSLACQAGKDVYVESPATHFIAEGPEMMAAAQRFNRVVQVGLQQRSGAHFLSAIDFLRSGRLGHVKLAKAWIVHRRKSIGHKPDCEQPSNVDYAQWLGPAPERPFNQNRFHFNWRWCWDFGGGELAHWGVHMLDVARWGLDVDLPHRVSAVGGKYGFNDDQETPDTLSVQYAFEQKSILWEHRLWSSHGIEGRSSGVSFHGDRGTLVVDRGGWKVYDCAESVTADSSDLQSAHLRNFVDCVRNRQTPAADLQIGHAAATLCHLGNIAYRVGYEVKFDPQFLNFGSDNDANALLVNSRPIVS